MKKYINVIGIILILILSLFLIFFIHTNIKYKEDLKLYDNNFKALTLKQDSLKTENIAYKFDIEQLEYINDSIINKLNTSRKQLAIKDKELKQMQYLLSTGTKKDTIVFKDTLFRDNLVKIDTLLGDKWINLKLEMLFPSTIKYNINYTSELEVFAHTSKEVLGTPKKCFIGRLFQKKYDIIRVEVIDNNPYSKIKENKFIIVE